jgi:hypothetical protein
VTPGPLRATTAIPDGHARRRSRGRRASDARPDVRRRQ